MISQHDDADSVRAAYHSITIHAIKDGRLLGSRTKLYDLDDWYLFASADGESIEALSDDLLSSVLALAKVGEGFDDAALRLLVDRPAFRVATHGSNFLNSIKYRAISVTVVVIYDGEREDILSTVRFE